MIEDILKKTLSNKLNYLAKIIGQEIFHVISNRILEYQIIEYKRTINTKTFLHRTKPVNLYDVYYPISLENKYNFNKSTVSAKKLFEEDNQITIIGYAGSGKSMLIKYLFLNCIDEGFKIPIKIELRYLNNYKEGINKYIFNEIFKFHELAIENRIIDRLLKSGKFVFFFDGFDELKQQKIEAINKEIDEFSKKYEKNSYLFTSRPHVNIELNNAYTNYFIKQLSIKETKLFISKQLLNKEVETKINSSIKDISKKDIMTFLSNPLLLSMYILTYQTYSKVPNNKSQFYRQVFDTLYATHDSLSKLSFEREKRSRLNKDNIELILRAFSFISYFGSQYHFSISYFEKQIELIKSKTDLKFEVDKILFDLLVAIAILVKDGNEYSYAHRSLQEYFAAEFISNLKIENKEAFYNNLIEQIFLKKNSISEFSNLFGLLLEIDYIYLLKMFCLPVLKKYNNMIDESLNNDFKGIGQTLPSGKFMIPIFGLIMDSKIDDIEYVIGANNKLSNIMIIRDNKSFPAHSVLSEFIEIFERKITETYERERFISNLI